MEIVFLYINEYKKLHDISVPLHGQFAVTHDHRMLRIDQVSHPDVYYQHIPMTLILGKNGVGKTSILDCLQEMCSYERCSAWAIFHHQGELYILFCNHPQLDIISNLPFRLISELPAYLQEYQTTLVTLNNAVDFNSLFFSSNKYPTRGYFEDASLSRYAKGSRARRNEVISRFSAFISTSDWLKKKMPDVDHGFHVRLLQPSAYRLSTIARNHQSENPKWAEGVIQWFYDIYSDYKINANYRAFPFCDPQTVQECASRIDSGHYDSLAEIISLLTKVDNKANLPERQLWRFIPAYAWGALSELIKDKQIVDDLYPELLISLYFSRDSDVLEQIQSWLKKHARDRYQKLSLRLPTERWEWRGTQKKLLELIQLIEQTPPLNGDNSAIFYNAEDIVRLGNIIQKIPEYLRDRIDFGWSSISSGEFAQAFLFSQIYHYLRHSSDQALIFLIDEVDLYLHPEWQRLFISELISFIKESAGNRPVQFIFTTHSPIIASDFLPRDIVCLDKHTGGLTFVVENPAFGFGSPLPEYYTGGFFVKYTIGDHAMQWLRHLTDKNNLRGETERTIIDQVTNEFLLRVIKGDKEDKREKEDKGNKGYKKDRGDKA